MASFINLKALGLNFSPNQLEAPEGSLSTASNVIIRRQDVIESRRGYGLYGSHVFSNPVLQLMSYQDRLLANSGSTLSYDSDGSGDFSDFSGSYSSPESGIRMKHIESNKNLYLTTDDGIKKISARNADDLSTASGFIKDAGAPKAVNIDAELKLTQGSSSKPLALNSVVAYRTLWGTKDINNNLILGAPSERATVYNPLEYTLIKDLNKLCYILDLGRANSGSLTNGLITNGTYSNLMLNIDSEASDIRTNLISLAESLDSDIWLADDTGTSAPLNISGCSDSAGVYTITFSAGDPSQFISVGDQIILAGFTTVTGINTFHTVTEVTSTTLSFKFSTTGATASASSTIYSYNYRGIQQPSIPSAIPTGTELFAIKQYLDAIISRLKSEKDGVIKQSGTAIITALYDNIQTFFSTTTSSSYLTVTIPKNINRTASSNEFFFQIYRSAQSIADSGVSIYDVSPSDELRLIYEAYPTQTDLDNGYITIEDTIPDLFRDNNTNLYTNPSSGDSNIQANEQPPLAKDINRFKNTIFYANTKTKQRLSASLVGTTNIADGDKLQIANSDAKNIYTFKNGAKHNENIEAIKNPTNIPNNKYLTLDSALNKYNFYIWYRKDISGSSPAQANKTEIKVDVFTTDTATASKLAQLTEYAIKAVYPEYFSVYSSSSSFFVENTDYGASNGIGIGDFVAATDFNNPVVSTTGVGEDLKKQISSVTFTSGSGLAGKYFLIYSPFDNNCYYVWYEESGSGSDPALANKTGVKVQVLTADADTVVRTKTSAALASLFTDSGSGTTALYSHEYYGQSSNVSAGTSGFTVSTTQTGICAVLKSTTTSSAQALEETSKSLVRIQNRNLGDNVQSYFISSGESSLGKIFFESATFTDNEYYLVTSSAGAGASFSPDLSPSASPTITAASVASTTVLTTSAAHGLVGGDLVTISNSTTTPSINGVYSITYVSSNQFSIPVNVSSTGTANYTKAIDLYYTENEEKPNRIYYSKFQQPEAVPLLNYLDVGAENEPIYRIMPIRDSLFVFKTDGLYRISGELAPFTLALFDSSVVLVAPDSVSQVNNDIFSYTSQGITKISEAGAEIISRPIDTEILKILTYPNFYTSTWGVGYNSDNSYTVYTVKSESNTYATVAYRYSTLTNTWTSFDKSNRCGIVHNEFLYQSTTDVNQIEKERKSFTRYDYFDREIAKSLSNGNYIDNTIRLASVSDVSIGDVLKQDQYVSIYTFNALLKKLDNDEGVTDYNYYSTLVMSSGQNLRDKLESLATKLDADSGVSQNTFATEIGTKNITINAIGTGYPVSITTSASHGLINGRIVTISGSDCSPSINGDWEVTVTGASTFTINKRVTVSGTTGSGITKDDNFSDIKTCFNKIISMLNLDSGALFNNYQSQGSDISLMEAVITAIDFSTKIVTLDKTLPFMQGDLSVCKAIDCELKYTPIHMNDPLTIKHMREATIMFQNKAFTKAKLGFSTDLMPENTLVEFNGDGNGIFGSIDFGSGFFGGNSNGAPFRTYIDRNHQRCRYLQIYFNHKIAREQYAIYGITITANDSSSERAYRK